VATSRIKRRQQNHRGILGSSIHSAMYFFKQQQKNLEGWRHGSGGRAPAHQVQGSEFKPKYQQKTQNKKSF
jgi:hypothetical protein